MIEYTQRRHPEERGRGARQHGQLRRRHGPRHRAAVQERLPGELQGLRGRLQARARCSLAGCSCSRPGSSRTPRYIINFPTKRHWRGKSRMEDIEAGPCGAGRGDSRPRHPLDRAFRPSAAVWAGSTGPRYARASRRRCERSPDVQVHHVRAQRRAGLRHHEASPRGAEDDPGPRSAGGADAPLSRRAAGSRSSRCWRCTS